jgi:hypothetical protein
MNRQEQLSVFNAALTGLLASGDYTGSVETAFFRTHKCGEYGYTIEAVEDALELMDRSEVDFDGIDKLSDEIAAEAAAENGSN